MIRGYFLERGGTRRPFVTGLLDFPSLGRSLEVRLLVDTGADRSLLSPLDARRLGVDVDTLARGRQSTGVGGQRGTRTIEAILSLDSFSAPLVLTILESPPGEPLSPIPSLLGRDIIGLFALILEQRTERVLLFTPAEADSIPLP
jgi:hypothetical protein